MEPAPKMTFQKTIEREESSHEVLVKTFSLMVVGIWRAKFVYHRERESVRRERENELMLLCKIWSLIHQSSSSFLLSF